MLSLKLMVKTVISEISDESGVGAEGLVLTLAVGAVVSVIPSPLLLPLPPPLVQAASRMMTTHTIRQ